MTNPGFITVKKILKKGTTDSSGDAVVEMAVGGQVVKEIVYATATGAHVTIKELITGENLTLSGDTIFDSVITSVATHIPLVNATDVTGSVLGSQYVHPSVDSVVMTIASGGNIQVVNAHIYVR